MRTLIAFIALLASFAHGAERKLDLRPAQQPGRVKFAAPLEQGVVRHTSLSGGVTAIEPLAVGDVIDFVLFDDVEISIILKEELESPLGGSSFIAAVEGCDNLMSAVVVQSKEGLQVNMQDLVNGYVYTVASSETETLVRELDPNAGEINACEPLVPGQSETTEGEVDIVEPSRALKLATVDQSSVVVDILVAYDQNAASWAKTNGGGLDNFAQTAVAKMNVALANNGLDSSFRFRLVGTTEISVSKTDVHDALYAIRDNVSGWDTIKTKRDEVGADIVTTLIDTGSAYGTTGVGWSLSSGTVASFAGSAYNVCSIRAVAQCHTMTHEVGHNMGAGHATAVNPDEISPGPQYKSYSAGYYFTANSKKYHTIMAYSFDGYGNSYNEAPLFSSPDSKWESVAAGDATHDNARTIKETYAEVVKWRAQKVALSYDVFFSPETETLFTDSVTVTLTPGKAGLAIRYTTDGSTPTLSSKLYSNPITLKATTTIKAATVNGGVLGPVYEAHYLKSDFGTALNAPELTWTTDSNYPWVTQTDNAYDGFAAQSCPDFVAGAGCYKTSWLKTTIKGPTEMGFRYQKISSHCTFRVYSDDKEIWNDSTNEYGIGSSREWKNTLLTIPSGTHVIKFAYEQSGWYYGGFNGVVLDTVVFDKWSHSPTISPTTTSDQATAMTFKGEMIVTLVPPSGRTGKIFYTLDGSEPTSASAIEYTSPFKITKSVYVQAVLVEPGKESSETAKGYFLERHPVKPGEWTTDVEGAKAAAAKDGKLIAVLCANQAGCGWTQKFTPIAESPEFLAWAEANGIYLITSDTYGHVDREAAYNYFWELWGSGSVGYPSIAFAKPDAPDVCVATGTARNYSGSSIAGVPYDDTVASLVKGFTAAMGISSVLDAPTISPEGGIVNSFPITVTLTNPNGSGTIYYTLDGSNPTKTNGTKYTGPFRLNSSGVTVKAAVWGTEDVSSPFTVRTYSTLAEILGTQGIVWTNDSSNPWTFDSSSRELHSCYKSGSTYTSTLTAVVSGKGKFSFKLRCSSNSSSNRSILKRDGKQLISFAYSGNGTSKTYDCVYELTASDTTTFEWTYQVSKSSYNYSGNGCYISEISWISDTATTTTTPVAVPHTWIAAQFPKASTSSYEALMNEDSDADGFTNWEEYLCGTDPNSAGNGDEDGVPRCTIEFVNGKPKVSHNIEIPSAAKSSGWRTILKGSSDLTTWTEVSAGNEDDYNFFKVTVEMK